MGLFAVDVRPPVAVAHSARRQLTSPSGVRNSSSARRESGNVSVGTGRIGGMRTASIRRKQSLDDVKTDY